MIAPLGVSFPCLSARVVAVSLRFDRYKSFWKGEVESGNETTAIFHDELAARQRKPGTTHELLQLHLESAFRRGIRASAGEQSADDPKAPATRLREVSYASFEAVNVDKVATDAILQRELDFVQRQHPPEIDQGADGSCNRDDSQVGLVLPGKVPLAQLDADGRATLSTSLNRDIDNSGSAAIHAP